MIEAIITGLIYICLLAIAVYLIIWVLQTVAGVALPPKVVQIIWVVVVLIALLILVRILLGGGGFHLGKLGQSPAAAVSTIDS